MKATGVVLAGGRSTRMGTDKALLSVGEQTMLSRTIAELKMVFPEVLVVNRDTLKYHPSGAREVSDVFPGMGPLAGLHAGLKQAKYPYIFCTACDMPYLNSQLGYFIVNQVKGYDAAVPKTGAYLQPLFAAYAKTCIPHIEEALQNDIRKVTGFYHKVDVNYLQEGSIDSLFELDEIFLNVNTPEEYDEVVIKRIKSSSWGCNNG